MYNNFDELIAGIHHSGNVISDPIDGPAIIIDGNKRTLTPEDGFNTQIGVTNDYNTNEITFKCNKVVEGHDLSACNNKVIKWHNTASNIMSSDKLVLKTPIEGEETFAMTWHVPPEAMTKAGTLKIAICFCDLNNEEKIEYKWNSLEYSGLQIAQGMDNISITGIPLSDIISVDVYTRQLSLPSGFNTVIGIQGAPGATYLTFRLNRFFNNWDFTHEDTQIAVLYMMNDNEARSSSIDKATLKLIEGLSGNEKDDLIQFDWRLPGSIFQNSGEIILSLAVVDINNLKIWRAKELGSLSIEPSIFGENMPGADEEDEGWLFISQEELTQLLNEEYNSISFYIDGSTTIEGYESNTYRAIKGMTWDEWVTTPYNTYGFTNGTSEGNYIGTIYKGVASVGAITGGVVKATDVIISNGRYIIA